MDGIIGVAAGDFEAVEERLGACIPENHYSIGIVGIVLRGADCPGQDSSVQGKIAVFRIGLVSDETAQEFDPMPSPIGPSTGSSKEALYEVVSKAEA